MYIGFYNKKKVFIAIINSKTQIVITGHYSKVYSAGIIAKKQFLAKIICLPISITPHCKLMKKYKKNFSSYLKRKKFFSGKNLLISNHDSSLLYTSNDIYNSLLKQIYKPVLWDQNIDTIISMGVDIFIEIGIGKILTNLNKKKKNIKSYYTNKKKNLLLIMDIIKKL